MDIRGPEDPGWSHTSAKVPSPVCLGIVSEASERVRMGQEGSNCVRPSGQGTDFTLPQDGVGNVCPHQWDRAPSGGCVGNRQGKIGSPETIKD